MGSTTRQVIVHLSVNDLSDDVVAEACKSLQVKALLSERNINTQIVKVRLAKGLHFPFSPPGVNRLKTAFKQLDTGSRVYLVAHGNWQNQTLAGASAAECAELLSRAGMPAVKVLSVLGCNCARDRGSADDLRVALSMDNFAGNLHLILGVNHGILTTVFGRSYLVRVDENGIKTTATEVGQYRPIGKAGAFKHKRVGSKWKFFWDGNRPRRAEAYTRTEIPNGIEDEFDI